MSSPVLWYATRATGIVALLLLTGAMVLGVLTATRFRTPRWPRVAQQDLHRRVSLLSAGFVGLHVLTSILDTYVHIGWAAVVVPFASDYKRWWVGLGAISLDLMLAVIATSLLRSRIPARLWRAVHWLAYVSWPVAVLHTLGAGTDARQRWMLWVVVACVLAVLGAALVGARQRLGVRRRAEVLPSVRRRAPGVPIKHREHPPAA